jgi:hypothetical protein
MEAEILLVQNFRNAQLKDSPSPSKFHIKVDSSIDLTEAKNLYQKLRREAEVQVREAARQ